MDQKLTEKLTDKQHSILRSFFPSAVSTVQKPPADSVDMLTLTVLKEQALDVLRFLRDEKEFQYEFLTDLTAVDEGVLEKPRFTLVYHLFSMKSFSRVRVKVKLHDGEFMPTAVRLWSSANWAEREVYDMYGICFEGHPDLRRILMDERFVGHPQRKDYPLRGYQIFTDPEPIHPELLAAERPAETGSEDPDWEEIWEDSKLLVNIGPTHPAMHGAFRCMAKLNGETIEKSYSAFGYTHRAKEKLGENRTYHQYMVYTDRLNYCSSLINNVAYAMSVEKLMGVQVPERCIWLRMICCELSRVIDHLICVGINAVDIGAFSFFLYGYHQREESYTLIEKLCGARLTTSYARIGGLAFDAPEGFENELKIWVAKTSKVVEEMDRLLSTNKIWCNRTKGVAIFNREDCIRNGFSGPNARAAGVDWDLRRDEPCMFYRDVKFEVPVTENGDVYDRYLVRMEEIRQSLRILTQCADRISKGPIWTDDKRVRIPEKEMVYNSMEDMIHHFKFFMNGFDAPAGEVYSSFEAANGELGFYIVSRGGPMAHRMRIRSPSFWHFQGFDAMIRGQKLADVVAALGSINIIAGELDR